MIDLKNVLLYIDAKITFQWEMDTMARILSAAIDPVVHSGLDI